MMSQELNDCPKDEKEALMVLRAYHGLVYQLLNMNCQRNLEIIRQHCEISAYFEKHIKSGATARECNDRILTFLEDRFSRHREYDKFIAVLRRLVDMPHAQTILDQMQKKLNQCFAERKEKEKLEAAGPGVTGTTSIINSTASDSAGATVDTTVDNNSFTRSRHQPSNTATEATSSTSAKKGSAHGVITGIISEKLYSTPGFDILESYKDRVCDSLPADYNTTAVRLQSLIGASDHMIQWVLTGEMSLVNQRIYQIVLVYVWCQPHFIKFCDIMEVLADDSITVGHIKALRKALIRHLYSDGHITAEEASHLESRKLFEAPVTTATTSATTTAATTSATTTAATTSATTTAATTSTLLPSVTSNHTTTTITTISFVHTCDVSVTSSDGGAGIKALYSSSNTSNITLTTVHSVATTNIRSIGTRSVTNAGGSIPQLHKVETEQPQCAEGEIANEYLLESDLGQNETQSVAATSSDHRKPSTKETFSITEADIPVVDEGMSQVNSVSVPMVANDAADSTTVHKSDDLLFVPNQSVQANKTNVASDVKTTEAVASPVEPSKLPTTTASAKPVHPIAFRKEKPAIATLQSKSDMVANLHLSLTQAAVGSSNQSDGDLNQLIDFIVGSKLFSYSQIAYLCLMPQQERTKMLMAILTKIKESQGEVRSKIPEDVPVEKKPDDTRAIGTEEIHHVLDNKDFALLKVKYTDILMSLPQDYGATLERLQNSLSDTQICDILLLTTGHNQKILNCLIMQLHKKEDLLDFCAHLEKIPGGPPSLTTIIKELRKEVTGVLQAVASPEQPTTQLQQSQSKFITATTAPTPPNIEPSKFHPKLCVIPLVANPFDSCLLTADSNGLVALKKCYPILIENLPSNLLSTLLRLLDIANIPEEVVDNVVQSSCAEVGNKIIINYLIGLVHTEQHIITFCNFAERMLGEFEKCLCILNLRNDMVNMLQFSKEHTSVATGTKTSNSAIAISDTSRCTVLSDKETDTEYDHSSSQCEAIGDQPNICSLIKSQTSPSAYRPYISDTGSMLGYLQCMTIGSYGGEYEENIKAIPPAEKSSDSEQSSKEKATPIISYINNDFDLVKGFVKKDYQKEFVFSVHDAPGAQQSRQFYLNYIEVLFRESTKGGAWIYYTGYGEEGTGNWCFKDGTITFQDIFTLYNKYYKGKILYIYSDCCYSGQWVVECAKCLDEMGIGACGHQAKKNGILIKVYTSCQPTQKTTYNTLSAELLNFSEKDYCLYFYINKKVSESQMSYGCDFTKIMCLQVEGSTAPCRVPSVPVRCSWRWQDVIKIDNRPSSLLFTIRGNDKGRKAWHCVLVEKELLEDFNSKLDTGTVDVSTYGYIVCSGFGENIPDNIRDKLKKYSPSYL